MTGIVVTIVGILAFFVVRTYIWQYNAKLNGVEAEANVSLIQHEALHTHPNGIKYPTTYYYVRFQGNDGMETEARLLNPKKELAVGSHVRIRYLPWREDVATLMEIMDEHPLPSSQTKSRCPARRYPGL